MNKLFTTAIIALLIFQAKAQSPNTFGYQAVVRNSSGLPLASASVSFRFTIREGSTGGTIIYQETQTKSTSSLGMVALNIGSGSVVSGVYPTPASWALATKYLQVEIDQNGGSSYVDAGTTQIVAVPYANYAEGSNSANNSKYADSSKKAATATTAVSAGTASNYSGTVNLSQLVQGGAANGEVMKWNGSQWAAGTDVGGGSGDNWGTQSAVTDATLAGNGVTGNALKIAQQGAGSGDVLAWNGSSWAPSAGGSVWTKTGNNINNNNSANVGINTPTPLYQLDVTGNTRITGSVGINVAPNTNYSFYAVQASKDNLAVFENNSAFNNTKLILKGTATNDFMEMVRYGSSVSGNYLDATTLGGSSSIMAGSNSNKLVAGTWGAFPIHLMTTGRTRMFISKEGKIGINKTNPKAYIDFYGSPGTADSVDPGWGFKDYIGILAEVDTVANKLEVNGIVGVARKSVTENNGVIGMAFGKYDSCINMGVIGYANNASTGLRIRNYGGYNLATNAKYNYGSYNVASGIAGTVHSYGVFGAGSKATNSIGVYGSANTTGSTNTYGGYFTSAGTGTRFASVHNGNVTVTGSISKGGGTFKIDHPQDPENKYLIHSFVESPDMMNVYNGNIVTDANGIANVSLPSYFQAENVDFKYQLTVIGQFAQAIVLSEIENNKFVIQTDKPNVKVSWQITGVRNDKFALANPIIPELEKATKDKGKYMHPELYGKPETQGIFYAAPPTAAKVPAGSGINP